MIVQCGSANYRNVYKGKAVKPMTSGRHGNHKNTDLGIANDSKGPDVRICPLLATLRLLEDCQLHGNTGSMPCSQY